jgi:hypothetical protein
MSRKKYTKTEINLIVNRALEVFGLKIEKELAELLDESQQSLSNKKNTGSIVGLIEKEAYKRKLDFNYILTGESSSSDLTANESHGPCAAPVNNLKYFPHAGDSPLSEITDDEAAEYAGMALRILKSKTRHAHALKDNILSFYEAVDDKRELIRHREEIRLLKEEVKSLKERLPETGE